MKIALVNLKGGVSKTTSSIYLATAFSRRGKTLLVDADPQGSSLSWTEGAEENGGEVGFAVVGLPTRDLHKKLLKVADDYEYVVIDTPPGDPAITKAALMASEVAIVPISAAAMDINRFQPTLEAIAEVEPLNSLEYRVLLTQVQRISREGQDARLVMEEVNLPVLEAEVPYLRAYKRAFGAPIDDLADYEAVANELLEGARV